MKTVKRYIIAEINRKIINELDIKRGSKLHLVFSETGEYPIEVFYENELIALVIDYWSKNYIEYANEMESIDTIIFDSKIRSNIRIEVNLISIIDLEKLAYFKDNAGIYGIESKKYKTIYVGQSSRIKSRLKKHFEDLSIGFHHNRNLQDIYINNSKEDLKIILLEEFPGKYNGTIEDRKWLEINEKKWIKKYADLKLSLNKTDGEFIHTKKTIIEKYEIENKLKSEQEEDDKLNDEKIKNEKKIIKKRILQLSQIIDQELETKLEPLRDEIKKNEKWIFDNTKFFSFFESRELKNEKENRNKLILNLQNKISIEYLKWRDVLIEFKQLNIKLKTLKTSKQLKSRSTQRAEKFLREMNKNR